MLKGDTFYKSHYSIFGIRVEFPGCKWSLDGPIINIWDPRLLLCWSTHHYNHIAVLLLKAVLQDQLAQISQIMTNTCKYHRNLMKFAWTSILLWYLISPYISVVLQKHILPSSRKEHWRAEFPTSFFSKSKGMSSTQRSWKVWKKCGKVFVLELLGEKKITVVAQYVHLTITNTLPETNIAPENWPSEKETSIPTKLVYMLCRNRVHLLLLMVHASGESVDMKPFFQPMLTGLDSMPPSNRMTSGKQILKLSATYLTTWFSSWWLNQSIWKMCVRQIGNHFPQNRGEILK